MATDENFPAQMVAMLSDPGQLDELRKRLLLPGGSARVERAAKPLQAKIFKQFKCLKVTPGVGGNGRLTS